MRACAGAYHGTSVDDIPFYILVGRRPRPNGVPQATGTFVMTQDDHTVLYQTNCFPLTSPTARIDPRSSTVVYGLTFDTDGRGWTSSRPSKTYLIITHHQVLHKLFGIPSHRHRGPYSRGQHTAMRPAVWTNNGGTQQLPICQSNGSDTRILDLLCPSCEIGW